MHALLLAIVAELLAVPAPPPGEYGNMVTVLTSAATQPADDAPLPRLVAFWSINRHNERLEPSQKVSERLVDAIEKHPDALSDLLAYLPAREEVCARVKKARSQPDSVSVWVLHHCASERDALFAAAASAKDKETWVEHGDDVQALARADWNRAKPLLEHFAGSAQPRLRALALSQLSIFEPNGRHRAELQSIAMDPNAPGYARDLAFDALSRDVWEGRDEWLLARMNDASVLKMRDGYRLYTPFDAIVTRDPDQWIPIMTRLVSDPDRNVRSIAANALAQFQPQHARADALRPLIPWISDPSFAEETSIGRLRLIQSVHSVGLTEAIPHLLYALTNDRDHVYRAYAAEALAEFHETRANAL
ncbi:MAG TPA: HEAT repeat domain-containing protein, partial [Thermoanaerobaculia bacterium]|nr:HEAT repeat domain-containing protein [Thermoanaerobaculia bacterium]